MHTTPAPFATGCTQWYTHFNNPSAWHRNGRTYIAFPDARLNPRLVCYDHKLRSWSQAVTVGRNPLVNDDHGNPALLLDRKGYLHVFYGCHGGAMKYAKSAKPESVDSWVQMPAPAPHATYPQVMELSDGTIYLFYRAGGHTDDWVYRTSADGGDKWSAESAVLDGVAPQDSWYATFVKGPADTVHVGFVWKDDNNALKAPGPEYVHRYDAFYLRRSADGAWTNAAGQRLTLPVSKAEANARCKVYDSISQKQHTGACPVGVDEAGRPYLMFRLGGPFGDTAYQHKLAKWTGRAWEIADAGPAVECGYADYVRDDNFQLEVVSSKLLRLYTVNIFQGQPGRTDLQQWESPDAGRTWSKKQTLFSATEFPARYVLLAPKLVVEHHPDAALVFGSTNRYLYGRGGFIP